jgi:hypothetical protein
VCARSRKVAAAAVSVDNPAGRRGTLAAMSMFGEHADASHQTEAA